MRMQELAVVVDFTREVGILLARRFEDDLIEMVSVVSRFDMNPVQPRICVPWSHW